MADFSDLLIITDLDGTFFDAEHKEHEGNCDAAERFIKSGGLFTIATGRPPAIIGDMLPRYKEICNIPMVTCNGSLFCDPADLSVTEEYPLDKEAAKKILSEVLALYPQTDHRIVYLDDQEIYDSADFEREGNIYKLLFFAEREKLDKIDGYVREKYSKDFWCTRSWETLFEVLDKTATKGNAVERIRRKYPGRKIIAMGDYENDKEMMLAADFAVCPENAQEEIKKICDRILCDNDRGTAAELINKLENGEITL